MINAPVNIKALMYGQCVTLQHTRKGRIKGTVTGNSAESAFIFITLTEAKGEYKVGEELPLRKELCTLIEVKPSEPDSIKESQ